MRVIGLDNLSAMEVSSPDSFEAHLHSQRGYRTRLRSSVELCYLTSDQTFPIPDVLQALVEKLTILSNSACGGWHRATSHRRAPPSYVYPRNTLFRPYSRVLWYPCPVLVEWCK